MFMPPVIARPFGHVVEPVRMKSASSFQKNVGLKISMYGSAGHLDGRGRLARVCALERTDGAGRGCDPSPHG
jgi:hypothetical protein